MGGKLDSTNVIPAPEVAVFTNIGLDHTEYLGDTAEAIAATKAGILKSGCDCVLYPNTPSVMQVIEDRCAAQGITLSVPDVSRLTLQSRSLEGQVFSYADRSDLHLSLLGAHQLCNAAVVLTVLDCLIRRGWDIPERAVREGLAKTRWQGRLEVLSREPLCLLDGGHNPQCMQALYQAIREYLPEQKLVVLTGVLADKDYAAMYDETAPLAAEFITVTPPNPRALPAQELARFLERYEKPVQVCESIEDGVDTALRRARTQGAAVLAYGSLYMAGEIRARVMARI